MKTLEISFVFEDDDKESSIFSIEVEDIVQLLGIIEGLKEEAEDSQVHVTVEALDFEFTDEETKLLSENKIHISIW